MPPPEGQPIKRSKQRAVGDAMVFAGFISSASFALAVTFEEPAIRGIGLLTTLGISAALMIKMTFKRRFLLPAHVHYTCCTEFVLLSSQLEAIIALKVRTSTRTTLLHLSGTHLLRRPSVLVAEHHHRHRVCLYRRRLVSSVAAKWEKHMLAA